MIYPSDLCLWSISNFSRVERLKLQKIVCTHICNCFLKTLTKKQIDKKENREELTVIVKVIDSHSFATWFLMNVLSSALSKDGSRTPIKDRARTAVKLNLVTVPGDNSSWLRVINCCHKVLLLRCCTDHRSISPCINKSSYHFFKNMWFLFYGWC